MTTAPLNMPSAFARSIAFHAALVGIALLWGWQHGFQQDALGAPDAGLPTIGITTIAEIPLPSRGPENPLVSEDDADVPQELVEKPSPKAAEKAKPEPADAKDILPTEKTPPPSPAPKSKLKSFDDIATNQLTSNAARPLSSPMMAAVGASQVNTGGDTTLGSRFPNYAAQIKEITRGKWRVQDVDRTVTKAPPVTVSFDLLKDGRATNVRLTRRSGVASLDQSVLNAVQDASYPPLPDGLGKDSVPVEFTFELRR
jgi:TonB family protein